MKGHKVRTCLSSCSPSSRMHREKSSSSRKLSAGDSTVLYTASLTPFLFVVRVRNFSREKASEAQASDKMDKSAYDAWTSDKKSQTNPSIELRQRGAASCRRRTTKKIGAPIELYCACRTRKMIYLASRWNASRFHRDLDHKHMATLAASATYAPESVKRRLLMRGLGPQY